MSDQSLFHELIEIGIFNLHFVHGAPESSFDNNEWKVKELLKVGLAPFKRVCFIYFNENSLKMIKSAFSFIIKKDQLIFKIYDVTVWLTNNYNTHIAECFMK